MLEFYDSSAKLVGHSGSIVVLDLSMGKAIFEPAVHLSQAFLKAGFQTFFLPRRQTFLGGC
jgi:hypothetical protein